MDDGKIRKFATGATRDTSADKLEPWGFISPLVLHRFSEYMHKHRKQSDGSFRDSDNWQKGIPINVYVHSLMRHVMDFWLVMTGFKPRFDKAVTDPLEIASAILFNVQGVMLELLKKDENVFDMPEQKGIKAPAPSMPRRGSLLLPGSLWEVDPSLDEDVERAFGKIMIDPTEGL